MTKQSVVGCCQVSKILQLRGVLGAEVQMEKLSEKYTASTDVYSNLYTTVITA